jgi:4-aminobutyrate aminotransferase-like enzyme
VGLFVGVDLQAPEAPADAAAAARLGTAVVNGMRARGVLLSTTGVEGRTLKIRPPLVFEPQHVDLLIDTLTDTLQHLNP